MSAHTLAAGHAFARDRRRRIHPAAGDWWVMPERHPQPRVGVSATYVRAGGDETSPRIRDQDPWGRRSGSSC